ncbi:MAG: FAD-dependent oxidoreductase [Bacteroidaceae bacterium]|nr:FAD-dependent oxidoreductase [Bacteroidaceae bacterium]
MDRRNFLKRTTAGAGLLAVSPSLQTLDAATRKKKKVKTRLPVEGYVSEPARQLPVVASADVVVVGGGPAGFAAAVSAARQGSSVILVERYNHLGGLWTGGLVLPVLSTHGAGNGEVWTKVVKGISDDVCGRLFEMGMARNQKNPLVDPEACKYVLDEMCSEAGVRTIFFSTAAEVIMASDERIEALVVETKSGRLAIRCQSVVDCSGDGDVMEWSGVPFREIKYHIGHMARLGNTDRIDRNAPGFKEIHLSSRTPIDGVSMRHMRGEEQQDGLDVFNLTRLQQKFRKEIWEDTERLKRQPGYERIFLLDTASQLGVRVTRALDAQHVITLEESMTRTAFDDTIGMSGASDPIPYKGSTVPTKKRPCWQIPYRSLLPRGCRNLWVAGRCFGFEEGLAWDAREIGTCFVTGQAAGTAAALAVAARCASDEVDVSTLQQKLREQRVVLSI